MVYRVVARHEQRNDPYVCHKYKIVFLNAVSLIFIIKYHENLFFTNGLDIYHHGPQKVHIISENL